MCYSALVKKDIEYLGKKFGAIAVREQLDLYDEGTRKDPKKYPKLHDRIYPGHYAPIIFPSHESKAIEVMRYGAFPPPDVLNPEKYTTFNARRDNLTSKFWSEAFMKHHGIVILKGFYEWVSVADLLSAGVVTLKEVELEFKRQSDERKLRFLSQGKKWKPTATELKDPRHRQIIIEFKSDDDEDLIVPVIFSHGGSEKDALEKGFAIVTDEPPFEIEQAGHDRCPVILQTGAENIWMHPEKQTAKSMQEMLGDRKKITFKHTLAKVA